MNNKDYMWIIKKNRWISFERLHKKIFKEPLKLENGYVIPPTSPGLGVELDYDIVKSRIVNK